VPRWPAPYSLEVAPTSVSTDALQSVETQVADAIATSTQTGSLRLEFTEAELASYLSAKLAAETNPILSDPQVVLQNGSMTVYGQAESGMFQASVGITMRFQVDAEGKPLIEITQADFGPLPAPQGLKNGISSLLQEALTGAIGPAAIGFRLERIEIVNGTMTITGRLR
jgi:hypothetical protein